MGTDLAPSASELGVAPSAAAEAPLAGARRAPLALGDGPLTAAARSTPIKAFVASRLLVLVTGAIGVLTVPAVRGWWMYRLGSPSPSGVGRLLEGSTVRYDSFWYLRIAAHGYGSIGHYSSRAFFPLYPWLIRVFGFLTGSDVTAGITISMVSFAVGLVLLHKLTESELGRPAADATVLLLAFAPLSFFFSAIYTESLFLALTIGAFYAARTERWALAGVLGGLASLTHITGVVLALPIAIMFLRSQRRVDLRAGWIALIPGALLVYLASLPLSGVSWNAPLHSEAAWGRVSAGPIWSFLASAVDAVRGLVDILGGTAIYHPAQPGALTVPAANVYRFVLLLVVIAVLVRCWRRLPIEYGAYATVALVMSIWSPQVGQPLSGLDRYILTIFPLWMVAGAWLAQRRLQWVAVGVSTAMLVFYTLWFSAYAFLA